MRNNGSLSGKKTVNRKLFNRLKSRPSSELGLAGTQDKSFEQKSYIDQLFVKKLTF